MRQEIRYAVDFPVLFYRDSFQSQRPFGTGRVFTLSAQGCQLESRTTFEKEECLAVRLYIPSIHPPINIHSVKVTHQSTDMIELEFTCLQAGEQERLLGILHSLENKT